jgi:hypothetical protein
VFEIAALCGASLSVAGAGPLTVKNAATGFRRMSI